MQTHAGGEINNVTQQGGEGKNRLISHLTCKHEPYGKKSAVNLTTCHTQQYFGEFWHRNSFTNQTVAEPTVDSEGEASSQTGEPKSTSVRQYALCNLQCQEYVT